MSATYRLVEQSRAASRLATPGPQQGRPSERGGLVIKDEKLDVALQPSGGQEEHVFEKLFEKSNLRGQNEGLGRVWLDGVSVSNVVELL